MTKNLIKIKTPDPRYPRHTNIPFPPYRYTPGHDPHPRGNPAGYFFGKVDDPIPKISPIDWRVNQRYLYGVDLYNFAYWWESHEAWEDLWRSAPKKSNQANFFQGLIKISAAFLKWSVQESRGVDQHYRNGVEMLRGVGKENAVFMGIQVEEHVLKLERHFKLVVEGKTSWPDPVESYPFIVLIR